jgi:hypothetical protein
MGILENGLRLFGYTFGANSSITQTAPKEERSPITPPNEDGALTIQATPYYGTYLDLEGVVRNEIELITKYREMSLQPELEAALFEIINEVIQKDEEGDIVELDLDDLKVSEQTKNKIIEEFENVQKLLKWNTQPDQIFKRWYIDGRIYYHAIVSEEGPAEGIIELRYIDPRKIRKVREVQKKKDLLTGAEIIDKINEYYIYSEKVSLNQSTTATTTLGIKIAPDSIISISSDIMDAKNQMLYSHLHKAIKPLNNLRMVEDAVVIYRLSRAPERRVFYIDTGNLPKLKAEQYLQDMMIKYRNKMVYDATTGEVRDDKKHFSMMEDFWIPRRGEGKSTEVSILQGAQNLGKLEDVEYFKKKLYESLNIPVSRLNLDGQGPSLVGVGRSTEVTREELKFSKFIDTLRGKFANLFLNALGTQLRLKNICNGEEWEILKQDIKFHWIKSNNFDELLEGELLMTRLGLLAAIDPYVGRFYSSEWVKKNVLQLNDEEIAEMDAQIKAEMSANNPATAGSAGMMAAQQADLAMQQGELGLQAQEVGIDYMKQMPAADKDTAAMIMAPVLTGQPLTAPQIGGPPGMGGAPGGMPPGQGGGGAGAPVAAQPVAGKQGAAMGMGDTGSVKASMGMAQQAQNPMAGQGQQQQMPAASKGKPAGKGKGAKNKSSGTRKRMGDKFL